MLEAQFHYDLVSIRVSCRSNQVSHIWPRLIHAVRIKTKQNRSAREKNSTPTLLCAYFVRCGMLQMTFKIAGKHTHAHKQIRARIALGRHELWNWAVAGRMIANADEKKKKEKKPTAVQCWLALHTYGFVYRKRSPKFSARTMGVP